MLLVLEKDVDCGGVCSGCGVGLNCSLDSDCISGNCSLGICGIASFECSKAEILCVDDDNSTGDAEYLTIQSAVNVVQPGQAVLVRNGVYREYISIPSNGTPSSRITIRNYPGENPIINKSTGGTAFTMTSKSNINIKGFSIVDLQFGASYGVALSNAENITIEGNYIASEDYKSGKCIKFDTYIRNLEIKNNNISFIDDAITGYSTGARYYNITILNNTIDGRSEVRPVNEVHCCEGSSCTTFPDLPACPHPDAIQFERNYIIDDLNIIYNNISDGDSANIFVKTNLGDAMQINRLNISGNLLFHTSSGYSKNIDIEGLSDSTIQNVQISSNTIVATLAEYAVGLGLGSATTLCAV